MPKISIQKTIAINAKPEDVFAQLSDFNHWKSWSPWLIAEPEATITVAEDGKSYHWLGKVVGEGKMAITDEMPPFKLSSEIHFIKPFNSFARTHFELAPEGDSTRVQWAMDSRLPFFMFWMKKSMEYFIGTDYERGLKMLKNKVEDGAVQSKLTFPGAVAQPAMHYVGIKTTCPMDQIPQCMRKDYEKLLNAVYGPYPDEVSGAPFSIYHKWKPLKNKATYTAAIPLKSIPDTLRAQFTVGFLPAMKVHKIGHQGPYRYVDNAWAAQMMYQRSKQFKSRFKYAPMEVYLNSPKDTPETELQSEICFPAK